jgi:hypothetical protein
MTDKPAAPKPPRPPLQLPPKCIDRTAERTGAITVVIGAPAAEKNGRE